MEKKGKLFVVSAPSGAGKTSICTRVLESMTHLTYSVSHTTRPPREGERPGVDYYFISKVAFKEKIDQGELVEWAEVHGNYYGTSRRTIQEVINSGYSLLLDIDVQGMNQITTSFPDAVTMFVMAPSMEILEERLRGRGTDPEEIIRERLNNAIGEADMRHLYQYVILNDDLETAVREMIMIMEKELL